MFARLTCWFRPGAPPAPFVVGVARSGTTLLRLMLDAHPELAVPPETGLFFALGDDPPPTPAAFLAAVTGLDAWPDLNLDAAVLADALARLTPFDPAAGCRCLFRLYAARFGKGRWGEKTPTHSLCIDRIRRLLPEARFVHIVRDGRDVALSLRDEWFSPGSDWHTLAAHWRDGVLAARAAGAGRPDYLELRYEDLLSDPGRVMRRVCRFAGLRYDPAVLRAHERAAERLGEVHTRLRPDGSVLTTREQRLYRHRNTSRPPDPSRAGRWWREMPVEGLVAFQVVAGSLLGDLGYPAAQPGVAA